MSTTMDQTERVSRSWIQHGENSDRVYLMKLAPGDCPGILDELDSLALRNAYGKIIALVPEHRRTCFLTADYSVEATVPRLFAGAEDGHYMAKYWDRSRQVPQKAGAIHDIRQHAKRRQRTTLERDRVPLAPGREIRPCTPDDLAEMAALYGAVFASYPFPIFDPGYLRESMHGDVQYFGLWEGGRLLALSSAEMNKEAGYVEMTDFATDPEFRRQGAARHLLRAMERAMHRRGMRTAITIARALVPGINYTFADAEYHFAGTLINNTGIGGGIESMNVWYKPLDPNAS